MDSKEKIELLKELLKDPEIKNIIHDIVINDTEKEIKKYPKKRIKKTPVKKPTKKIASKNTKKPKTTKKVVEKVLTKEDKLKREYGRSTFHDNLSEAVVEIIDGKEYNLIKLSKAMKKVKKEKKPRAKLQTKTCVCGKTFQDLSSYLCDSCLRGRNA